MKTVNCKRESIKGSIYRITSFERSRELKNPAISWTIDL